MIEKIKEHLSIELLYNQIEKVSNLKTNLKVEFKKC
jgi:hypothetical protein